MRMVSCLSPAGACDVRFCADGPSIPRIRCEVESLRPPLNRADKRTIIAPVASNPGGPIPCSSSINHGSSVCAAKVRFALAEKELPWTGYYLDILKGDQFDPVYRKLNPKAVVPTLVHDGKVLTESTVICEYLDDVFPEPPLRPAGAYERAKIRVWTKAVDEEVHPACAEVTFASTHRHTLARLPPDELARFLASTPPGSVTPNWHERKKEIVRQGFEAQGIDRPFRLYDRYLQKMEDALAQHDWLAGDRFSLADVAMTPYVNRLAMLGMSELWTGSRPRLTDWFDRITSRPAFKPSLLDWCPPDLTSDLATFGRQSWPEVRRILAAN
jgi:glutathione S-transferase